MLRVPDLKPGEQPFDPEFFQAMNPWTKHSAHSLAIGPGGWKGNMEENAGENPEERVRTLLNLAVVKEAVTEFHRAEDRNMRELESFASSRICDIPSEHEMFLRQALSEGETSCKNEDQKLLFRKTTAAFIAKSRMRALELQRRKASAYWRDAVEAQNGEFLSRALRPENLADDAVLAAYRDLIFYNLENMLVDCSGQEQKDHLAAAGRAFYRKVMETRLEFDPAGALAMAEEQEILRLLGGAECAEIAERAAGLLREREIAAAAAGWAETETAPADAERLAQAGFADKDEREYAMRRYQLARFDDNRNIVAAAIENIAAAWDRLKKENFDENALPGRIAGSGSALAGCLRDCLRRRGDAGGGDGAVDYPRFLAFLLQFEREGLWKTMEQLRDAANIHSLVLAAGGPDAELWVLCVRLLGGEATEEDKEYAAALRQAWGDGRSGEFMKRFADAMKREEDGSALAVFELVRKVEGSFPKGE